MDSNYREKVNKLLGLDIFRDLMIEDGEFSEIATDYLGELLKLFVCKE
jgi:hypothetical protein